MADGANDLEKLLFVAFSVPGTEGDDARKFLDKLQNRPEAWSYSSILRDTQSSSHSKFFAASTLKHKIIHDLSQLSASEISDLKAFLQGQLVAFKDDRMVLTQLALAFSALVVQLDSEGAASELIRHITLPISLDNKYLLILLAMIPEQYSNKAIPKVTPLSQAVIKKILEATLGFIKNSPSDNSLLVDALGKWVELAREDGGAVSSPRLLKVLFSLLMDGEESVGEIITNLIYLNDPNRLQDQSAFHSWFRIFSEGLSASLKSPQTPFKWAIEIAALCGEFYLDFIIQNYTLLEAILVVLFRALKNEDEDNTMVEATLSFWDALSEAPGFESVFKSLFEELIGGPLLKFPTQPLSAEDLDAFREFRHIIGDTLKTCVRYIGSFESISIVNDKLVQLQSGSCSKDQLENLTESLLFVMRTIASAVERRESEILPKLLSTLLFTNESAGAPKISASVESDRIKYSKNLVIGCYADWANAQGKHCVESLVKYLMGNLKNTFVSSEILLSAAMALMFMAESSPRFFPLEEARMLEKIYFDNQKSNLGIKARHYLAQALGLIFISHSSTNYYLEFIERHLNLLGIPLYLECYSCIIESLEANELLLDLPVEIHRTVVWVVLQQLPRIPTFLSYDVLLKALFPELLPPEQLVPFIQSLYIDRQCPLALRYITKQCGPELLSPLLEICFQHLIEDDFYDFLMAINKLLQMVNSVQEWMIKLIDRCLDIGHSATYTTPLCALLKFIAGYPILIQKIVTKALLEWPAPAIYELGQSVWRFKLTLPILTLIPNIPFLGEREANFWSAQLTEAEHANKSRAMKEALHSLSELCRRRSP
jgi:hypothetical protein